MKFTLVLIISVLLFNCSETNKETDALKYYDVSLLNSNNNEKRIIGLEIDTVKVNSSINTSGVGYFWINNNQLYFSDFHFAYVFHLSLDGNLKDSFLGLGEGPKEIPDLDDIIPNEKDGYIALSSSSSSLYKYNKNWSLTDKLVIDFDIKRSYNEVLEKPIADIADSYELETGFTNILKPWDEDHAAIAINATHPKFNGYFNTEEFYKYSRILALINLDNGKITRLVGRRSPVYLQNLNIPNFNHFSFEVDKKFLYLNFMPDHFIYVTDKKSDKAIGKFGEPGRDMKINYIKTDSYETAEASFISDFNNFGYYHSLKVIPQDNLIIRQYNKGKDAMSSGIQIYHDFNLIADLDIPLGFKIIGKINNDFIGYINDPNEYDSEELSFYKIKFIYEMPVNN